MKQKLVFKKHQEVVAKEKNLQSILLDAMNKVGIDAKHLEAIAPNVLFSVDGIMVKPQLENQGNSVNWNAMLSRIISVGQKVVLIPAVKAG